MKYLIEGPLESDYSLAIVNRLLAYALLEKGVDIVLHQRDNTTAWEPSAQFQAEHPKLAWRLCKTDFLTDVHTRNIYPPYTDRMCGELDGAHCYAWEESVFPAEYAKWLNEGLDFVTTNSEYTLQVLKNAGVRVPLFSVGLGVDHILQQQPVPVTGFERSSTFDFLHVSSCFPRKGVDVLIEAFCRGFERNQNVRLVIKTFPNPHNNVHELISAADRKYPEHAPILLIKDPLTGGQLRWLYEDSGCVVVPSRGEGFGLPAAEAMLLRTPVIATAYSGLADFCDGDTCWPIDFELAPARSHVSERGSVWAEPNVSSLQAQMQAVRNATSRQLQQKLDKAKRRITDRFTWAHVAARQLEAIEEVRRSSAPKVRPAAVAPVRRADAESPAVGIVTSWNCRCGIAEYTRYIVSSFPEQGLNYRIFASETDEPVREDESFVSRSWEQGYLPVSRFRNLVDDIRTSGVSVVSVQYNYGFFHGPVLDYLISRLQESGIAVAVTMHAIRPPMFAGIREPLSRADLVVVHREEDREFLLSQGLNKIGLLPMGNPVPRTAPERSREDWFTISSFGFLLPFKGVYELIAAFACALRVNPYMRLELSTALYPLAFSAAYANACKRLIEQFHMGSRVILDTRFLDDDAVLDRLCESDLVVLPYTYSTESASAAIRLPLSSMRPVLCSDLPVFQDAAEILHFYPAGNTAALARRIIEFSMRPAELYAKEAAQRAFTDRLAWPRISTMFVQLCLSVMSAEKQNSRVAAQPAT